MPKKGNVKKYVSKQVKKDKQQKGSGGPMINMMREGLSGMVRRGGGGGEETSEEPKTVNVVIGFRAKTRMFGPFKNQWETAQQLKSNKGESPDNDYYIDTFLSRKILEVLKEYENEYEKIVYIGFDTIGLNITDHEKDSLSHIRHLFTKQHNKLTGQPNNYEHVEKNVDIKEIEIEKLNTFALITTFTKAKSTGDYSGNIKLPENLNFKLTLKKDVVHHDKSTLQADINKEIEEKIEEKIEKKIKELESNDEENKKSLAELEKQREAKMAEEYEKVKEKGEQKKAAEEKKNDDTIKFADYLYDLLGNKDIDVNREINDWRKLVNDNFEKMEKIVDQLKKLENALDLKVFMKHKDGGKKHSKREVLGKTMVIYKIQGDRKEYVKHKGKLTTVKDYKELMKAKKAKPK